MHQLHESDDGAIYRALWNDDVERLAEGDTERGIDPESERLCRRLVATLQLALVYAVLAGFTAVLVRVLEEL